MATNPMANVSLNRAQSRANASTPYKDSQVFGPTQPNSQANNGAYGPTSPGATSRAGRGTYQTQPVDRPAPNAPSPQGYPVGQEPNGPSGGQPSGSPVQTNGLVAPPAAPSYHAGQLPQTPLPTYQAAQFSQFQNPLNQQVGQAHNDLMLRILQTPESLDPQTIAMMKEREKEQALQAWHLQAGQLGANAAARGMSDSGQYQGQLATGQTLVNQGIFGAMRDIDIAAAQQNQADRLAAVGAGNQYQSGVMDRGVGAYGATLQGQGAQADDNFRMQQTQADAVNFALQRALQQEQLYQAEAASGQQSYGLAQQGEQARLNYGLGVAGLQNQGQSDLMRFIQDILNRG